MSEDLENRFRAAFEEGRDLVSEARKAPLTLHRDAVIETALKALGRKRSVLLVGPDGVGKTAILLGIARALARGQSSASQGGVRMYSTAQIMAGTLYVGDWQSKLKLILEGAEAKNVVVGIADPANLATAGVSTRSDTSFVDALDPWLAAGRARLIAAATPDQLQAFERRSGFAQYFERITAAPLEPEQIRDIVRRAARRMKTGLDRAAENRLFELCAAYLPAVRGPGPFIEMLARLDDFREAREKAARAAAGPEAPPTPGEPPADPTADVEGAFGLYTGLPEFVVSKAMTKPAREIRDWFRARVIGQEQAIDAVVEMITLFKARLHDRSKPIGTALFVGPTGVGKTELARALAQFFFGSDKRLLRFDMSEFSQPIATEMLIGAPYAPERPARLLDPVRAMPFQVVLFDEIEKAHPGVLDLFLQLLDEGRLSSPAGEVVDFRNTILIATSNAGAFEGQSTTVGFVGGGPSYDEDRARRAIEAAFRPEFLNRFQHISLFHPLTPSQARRIAEMELQAVLTRDGVHDRNLIVDVDPEALDHVLAQGFDPRFGGRAIKRVVKNAIVMPIATLLMERDTPPGSIIRLRLKNGRLRASVTDTPESREFKAEARPVRQPDGRRASREEVLHRAREAAAGVEALAAAVGTGTLRQEIEAIDAERRDHRFWEDAAAAARTLARQTRRQGTVSRVDGLRDRAEQLLNGLNEADTKAALEAAAARLVGVERALATARRELLAMPPEGYWDALVEIAPIARGAAARDHVYRLYADWARARRMSVEMLREPVAAGEPAVIAVRGAFAFGYLMGEAGRHRLRVEEEAGEVARVRVAPILGEDADAGPDAATAAFSEQRALKAAGAFGGRLRSRVAVEGSDFVLQNGRSLAENRDLARELVACWRFDAAAADRKRRRTELAPFLLRDHLLALDFGRAEYLKPEGFHELLALEVDRAAQAAGRIAGPRPSAAPPAAGGD